MSKVATSMYEARAGFLLSEKAGYVSISVSLCLSVSLPLPLPLPLSLSVLAPVMSFSSVAPSYMFAWALVGWGWLQLTFSGPTSRIHGKLFTGRLESCRQFRSSSQKTKFKWKLS